VIAISPASRWLGFATIIGKHFPQGIAQQQGPRRRAGTAE
jgi:hypothetical protein